MKREDGVKLWNSFLSALFHDVNFAKDIELKSNQQRNFAQTYKHIIKIYNTTEHNKKHCFTQKINRIVILCAGNIVLLRRLFTKCISSENTGYFPQFRIFYHSERSCVLCLFTIRYFPHFFNRLFSCVGKINVSGWICCTYHWESRTNGTVRDTRRSSKVKSRIFYELFVYFAWYANTQWMLGCLCFERVSWQCCWVTVRVKLCNILCI